MTSWKFETDTDASLTSDFSFKYVPEDELSRVIKKVRRDRQRKHEQQVWEDFCRAQINDPTPAGVADDAATPAESPPSSEIESQAVDATTLGAGGDAGPSNVVTESEEDDYLPPGGKVVNKLSNHKTATLDDATLEVELMAILGEDDPILKKYQEAIVELKKRPEKRSKKQRTAQETINIKSELMQHSGRTNPDHFEIDGHFVEHSSSYRSGLRSWKQNRNVTGQNSVRNDKFNISKENLALELENLKIFDSNSDFYVKSGINFLKSYGNMDGTQIETGRDTIMMSAEGQDVDTSAPESNGDGDDTRHENTVYTNDMDSATVLSVGSYNDIMYNYEDPLFLNKLKVVRCKIGTLLDQLRPLLYKVNEPNSPADMQRLKKRDLEFFSRFSRNYLYQLQRLIIEVSKLLKVSKKRLSMSHAASQKIINAHQLVMQGLQAYMKHVPMSLEYGVSDRLKELIDHFSKLTEMCIEDHLLKNDDLKSKWSCIINGNANLERDENVDDFPDKGKSKGKLDVYGVGATNPMNYQQSRFNMYNPSPYRNRISMRKKGTDNLNQKTSSRLLSPKSAKDPNIKTLNDPSSSDFLYQRLNQNIKRPAVRNGSYRESKMLAKLSKRNLKSKPSDIVNDGPARTKLCDQDVPTMMEMLPADGASDVTDHGPNHPAPDTGHVSESEFINGLARQAVQNTLKPLVGDLSKIVKQSKLEDLLPVRATGDCVEDFKQLLTELAKIRGGSGGALVAETDQSEGGTPNKKVAKIGRKPDVRKLLQKVSEVSYGPKNAKIICVKSKTQSPRVQENITNNEIGSSQKKYSTENPKVTIPKQCITGGNEKQEISRHFDDKYDEIIIEETDKTEIILTNDAVLDTTYCIKRTSAERDLTLPLNVLSHKPVKEPIPESKKNVIPVPNDVAQRAVDYRSEYQKYTIAHPLYSSLCKQHKPWEMIGNIADKLVDESIAGLVKELAADDILKDLYALEFC